MSFSIVINVVFVFFGFYLIFIALKMKKEQKLNSYILHPEDIRKCKDVKGYIKFMLPKMIILGIAIILVGVMGILDATTNYVTQYRFITLFVFVITFGLYIQQSYVAKRKFMY